MKTKKKHPVNGQRESCIQYIKEETENNAIITEGSPY